MSTLTPARKAKSPVDTFCYWVTERVNIHRKRKHNRPKPWTEDEIMQRYFFTTPFREWDKSTVWLRENFRDLHCDSPEVFFGVVAFRWFNIPSTGFMLKEHGLLTDWDTDRATKLLRDLAANGNVFSGAYRIAPPMFKGDVKSDIVCQMLEQTWARRESTVQSLESSQTLERAWLHLKELPGIGPFTAYELVSDLRWTYLLRDSRDIMTWANPGPGAARGMNRILGRPLKDTCFDWLPHARDLLATVKKRLRYVPRPHRFEMREIEHSLCEFDKYERAKEGGRMKRRFNGLPD